MRTPPSAHAPGILAAVVLSCLTLAATGCSRTNPMATDASQEPALTVSADHLGQPLPSALLLEPAANFAVLGGSSVTSTGLTVVTGDLGVSPGTTVTGFGPGVVNGTIHAGDAVAAQAQSAVTAAHDALVAIPCATNLTGQDLGGKTLTPGVYCFDAAAQLTGILALDAQGDPGAVFVIKVGGTLTTAASASVLLFNGARVCNVYWPVAGSVALGAGTSFAGNILAMTNITLAAGASLSGRALARTGTVSMNANAVTVADCAGGGPGECTEKVTGGGSILVDGGMANFGFVVSQKGSEPVRGQLRYENHATGASLHMDQFSALLVVGNTATFIGTGLLDGLPGTFTVTVVDEGEPGKNDRFTIAVTGGPAASGVLRGGNIQIHERNCGGRGDVAGELEPGRGNRR